MPKILSENLRDLEDNSLRATLPVSAKIYAEAFHHMTAMSHFLTFVEPTCKVLKMETSIRMMCEVKMLAPCLDSTKNE